MTSERTEAADMTDDLQAENARWLRNYIDGQADTMDTMRAEVDACHANINTKADFIDATINQLAYADEVVDTLRAEVARLRSALQSMVYETTHLSPLQDDGSHWCKISHVALAEARAALSDVSS